MLSDTDKALIQSYLDDDLEDEHQKSEAVTLIDTSIDAKNYYLELLELNAVLKQWWMKTKV